MVVSARITHNLGPVMIDEQKVGEYTKALVENGAENARQMVRTQSGSGVHYPNLPNRSSAPGEAPVNQSGQLAGSIVGIVHDSRTGEVRGEADHEQYLEYGSAGGKIAPRPHLRPGLDKSIRETPVPDGIVRFGTRRK